MVWLIYAVLPRRPIPAGVRGVDNAVVELVGGHGLCAAATRHEALPVPSAATVLAYGQVVTTLFSHAMVLPMRFGTSFASHLGIQAWIGKEQQTLAARLQRLDGCVEYGLRIHLPEPAAPPCLASPYGPGHAYLASRRSRCNDGGQIAAALADYWVDWRYDGRQGEIASLSFLVPQSGIADFCRRCREVAEGRAMHLSGPWPPYSFADAAP